MLLFHLFAVCVLTYGSLTSVSHAGWPVSLDSSLSSVDIEPGLSYLEGSRVRDPESRISLVVPRGWRAVLPPGLHSLSLESTTYPGIGLVVWRAGVEADELIVELSEPQALEEAYILHPLGTPKRDRDRIAATYQAGRNCGVALALVGPGSRAIVMLMTGPDDRAAYYAALLEDIADTVRFNDNAPPPEAESPT